MMLDRNQMMHNLSYCQTTVTKHQFFDPLDIFLCVFKVDGLPDRRSFATDSLPLKFSYISNAVVIQNLKVFCNLKNISVAGISMQNQDFMHI